MFGIVCWVSKSSHLFSPAVCLGYILEHFREITVKIVCKTIRTKSNKSRSVRDPIRVPCAKIRTIKLLRELGHTSFAAREGGTNDVQK